MILAPQFVPIRSGTNVKYALSNFLQDRRTSRGTRAHLAWNSAPHSVRSHSFCALSHSSCATHPTVPAPSCTHPLVLCEKRPLHGTQRADRRTFCGILCRVAQILWDNPRTIYGM